MFSEEYSIPFSTLGIDYRVVELNIKYNLLSIMV